MNFPNFRRPRVETRTVEVPKFDLPKFDLPKVDLPKVDLPKVDLSNVSRPGFDLPDLSGAGRAVGSAIDTVAGSANALGRSVARSTGGWRLTRERDRSRPALGIGLLAGLGTGMALMFFLDPDEGRRRRALFVDGVRRLLNTSTRTVQNRMRDLGNRGQGLAAGLRSTGDGGPKDQQPGGLGLSSAAAGVDVASELEVTDQAAGRQESVGVESATRPEVYGETWGDSGSAATTPLGGTTPLDSVSGARDEMPTLAPLSPTTLTGDVYGAPEPGLTAEPEMGTSPPTRR